MKIVIFVITTTLLFSPAYAEESKKAEFDFEKIMAHYTFLSPVQVKTKWGLSKLKKEDFKKSDLKEKGSLAAIILADKSLLQKDKDQIIKLLGEPDAYFFSEQNLTYLISKDSNTKERWALTFLINSDLKVQEIRVVKTCCY